MTIDRRNVLYVYFIVLLIFSLTIFNFAKYSHLLLRVHKHRDTNTDRLQLLETLNAYKHYHESVLKGEVPSRVLIYECLRMNRTPCGGIGDRLKGISTSLVLAMLSKRALIISADKPMGFETVFYPHHIAWNLTTADTSEFRFNNSASHPHTHDEETHTHTHTQVHNMSEYIRTHVLTPIVDTHFHPLIPQIAEYVNARNSRKLKATPLRSAADIRLLKNIYSSAEIVRLCTNIKMSHKIFSLTKKLEHTSEYVDMSVVEILRQNMGNDNGKTIGYLLRFMFLPGVNLMMMLQGYAVDFARQMETRKNLENLRLEYAHALNNNVAVSAFKKFSFELYEQWRQIRPQSNYRPFKDLLNTMIMLNDTHTDTVTFTRTQQRLLTPTHIPSHIYTHTDELTHTDIPTSHIYTHTDELTPTEMPADTFTQTPTHTRTHKQHIENIVGAHFRVGGRQPGFSDSKKINKPDDVKEFSNYVHNYTLTHNVNSPSTLVIYVSDDTSTRTSIRYMMPTLSVVVPSHWNKTAKAMVVHLDRTSKKVEKLQELETFSEMMLLTMCDSLVVTRSGFSRMGWMLPSKDYRNNVLTINKFIKNN